MSLHINIPKIAITPEDEENDEDDNNLLNLAEALTDVEELFEDHVSLKRNSFRKKLRIKVTDNDGYNTALEDVEASDDDDSTPKIVHHKCPISIEDIDMEQYSTEENYGIAQKQLNNFEYLNSQSSNSNETLLLRTVELSDSSPLTDVEDYDTENEFVEDINIPEPEIHEDNVETIQIITISDEVQDRKMIELDQNFLECGTPLTPTVFPNSLLEEKVIKRPKKPPTFSQIMKCKDGSGHARMRKRKRNKINPRKFNEQKETPGNDSSENESSKTENIKYTLPRNSLNYESDVEEENKLQFPVCKKTFTKNKLHLKMPEFDLNVKTDIEDFECESDTYRRHISVDSTIIQNQLDEMASCYSFSKDKSETIQKKDENKEKFKSSSLDINTTTLEDQDKGKMLKPSMELLISASPLEEGGLTDVENISDSQDHEQIDTIDQKVHSEYDTEEELFKGLSNDTKFVPDIILPPPTRMLVIAEEKRSLIPTVRILPLDDNFETDSEFEEASTEDESINSATEFILRGRRPLSSPQLPNIEGENVKMSENSINPLNSESMIEEIATDVEDLDGETTKDIKKVSGRFLVPNKPSVGNFTDLEDKEMSDFQSYGQVLQRTEIDGHTDLEYLDSSDEDSFSRTELQGYRKSCLKLKFSTLIQQGLTDTEDLVASTDDEINYSRADTATPHEIKKELDYMSSFHLDIENSSKIDYSAPEEVMYLKGGGFQEIQTDKEWFLDDAEPYVQDVMDAWEYFKQNGEINAPLKKEWNATEDSEKKPRSQPVSVGDDISASSVHRSVTIPQITYESILLHPNSKIGCPMDTNSYAQIDVMLEKMLIAVDEFNMSIDNHTNSLTLEPSSDALIEIPIKKLKSKKVYTTTANIFVAENELKDQDENSMELYLNNEDNTDAYKNDDIDFSSSEYLDSFYKDDIFFNNNTNNNETSENLYEPIDLKLSPYSEDPDYVWWEGTYRNLSIVVEEDEDNYGICDDRTEINKPHQKKNSDISVFPPQTFGENIDCGSESSQIFSSLSTEESDSEMNDQLIKAEVKLMITSQEDGLDAIEVKSVKEFMLEDDYKVETIKNKIPKKKLKLKNKLINILDKRKSESEMSLMKIEKSEKKKMTRPSFTIPRIFIKGSHSKVSVSGYSRRKNDIVAMPNDNFPLAMNQETDNMDQQAKIDLFANRPFYPVYSHKTSSYTSEPSNITTYVPPSDVMISEAYCNWSTETENHGGNTTSTQYLIKLEEKLPDKTLDPPIVAYPNFELNNFTSYCNETNAFLQFETEIEKSDIQTSVLNPVKSLNFESSISNEPNVIFSNSELAYNIPQVVNIPNLGENKLFAIQVTKKLEEVSHTSDFEHSKSSPLSEDKKFSHTWIDAECKFSEGKEATKIFNETSLKGALLSTDSKEETMIIEKQDCETSKESLQDTEKYKTKEDGPPRVDDDQVIKYKVVTHDESKLMEVTERVKISKIAGEKQKLKISINEKPVRKNGDEWLSAEILERTSQFLSSEKKNYNDGRGFLPKTGYENNNVTSKMNEVVKSKEILDLFNTLEENTIFAENYYDNKQENEVEIEQISDSFNMKKETTIKSMKNGEKTSPPVKNSGFVRFCQNKSEKEMLNENKHSDTPKNEDSSQLNDKSRETSLKEEPTSENQKGALKEEGVGNKRNYNEMTQDIAICWTSELSKITDNFLNVEKNYYDDMEWSKLEVIFNNKNEVREQIELLQRSQGIKTIETNNEDNQQKFNKIELKPTRKENLNESEERSHLNKKIVAIEIQQIEDYPELKKASSSFVMEEIERYEDSKLMYKELKDYREIENKNEEDLPEYLQEKSKGFISNEMKHFHDVKYTTVKNESATEGQNNEGDTEFKHESNHGASDTYSDEINMKQKYLKDETSERNEVSNRNIENDNTGIPKELNEEETIVRSLENQQMKNELIEKKEDSLKKSEKSVFPSFSSDKSKNNILCDNQHESSKKSEYPESNQIIANFLEQEEGKYDDGIYIASTFKTKKLKKDEFIITPLENIETNEESDRIKNKLLPKTLVVPFFAEESKQDITSIDGQKDLISKETDSKDNFSKLKQITTNFLSVEKNKYDDGITITNIIHIREKNEIFLENRKNKDELEYNKEKSLEKTIPTNLFKEKSKKNIPRDNKPSLVKKNKHLKGNCSETKLIKTSLNSPEKENENGLYHARKIQIQEPKEEKVIHTILANQKMKEESDEIKGSSEKILLTHFLEGKLKPDIPNDIHQEDENSKSKETTANFLLQEREKYEDSSKFRIQKPKEEVTEEPLENPEIKGEFNKIKKESSKKSLFTTFFTEKSKIDITSADEQNSILKETYSTYSKMKEITTNFLLEEKYKYDDGINLTGKIQIREKTEEQVIEIPLQNQKNKDILKKIEEESSKKTVFISPFKEKSKKDILRDSAPDFVSRDKDMMKEDYSKSREITRNFLLWEKEKYQDSIDHASKIKIEEPRKEKVIIDSPPGNKKLKEASDKTGKQSSTKTFFGSLFTGKTIKTAGEQKETNSKENYSKLIEITSHFLAEEKTKCEDEITLASKVQIRKKNGKNVIEIPLGNQNELEEPNNITEESTTKTFSTSLVTEKVNKQIPIDKEPILTRENKSVKDNSELKEKITNFLPRKKGKDEDGISRLSNIQIPASNDESFINIPSENQNIISGEAITGLLPSDKTSYITNEFLNMELRNYNDNVKYHEFDMECERKRKINREKICSIDMPQNEEKTIEIDSDKEKKHNAFPKQTENKAALKIDGDHKKIVINEDITQESILFPKKHEKRGVFRLFKEMSKEENETKHSEVTQMTPGDKKLDLNSNDNINQNEDEINLSSEEIIDKTKELRTSEMNKYHDVKYSQLFNITEEQKDEQINSVEINRECSNTDHSILSDKTTKTSVSYKASKESEELMKSEKTGNISFFKRKSISDTQSESKREEDGEFTEPDQVRDKKIVFSGRQELNKGIKNDDNMHNESEIIWSPILLQKLCNDFLNSELELYQDAVYSKSIEPETENMKTINENILEHRRAITLFRDSTTSDRGFNLGSSNLEQLNQLNDFRQDETRKENFSIGSRKVSEGNESTEMRIDTFIVPDLFKDNLKTKTEDDCVTMDNIAQCDEGEDLLALKIASSAFLFNEKEVYEDCRQVIERSEYCPAHLAILPFEEEKQIDMITRDDTLQNERININCSPTQMDEFLKNEIQFYDCIKFNNSMTKSKDKELIIEEVCDNTDESEKTGLKETPKQSKKHAKNAFMSIFTQNPKTTTMNDSHNLSEKNEQFKMTKEQYKKINIEDERENEDIYKVSHEQTDSGPYLLTSEFLSSEIENYQDSKYSKNKKEENRNIFEPFVSEGRYNTESESKVKNEIIQESSSEIANAKQEISSDISTEIRMPSKKEEKSAILNYFKNRFKKRYMGQSETEKNSKQEEYEKTQLKNESSAFLFKEKEIYEDSLYEVGNNSIENESKIRINGISIQSSPSDPWEQRSEQTRWEECSAIEQNKQISSAFAEQNENLSNVDSMVISHELAQITRTFLDRERNIDGDIINVSIRGVPDEDLKTQKKDKKNTFELLRGALISKFKDDCYTPNYIQETTDFLISEQQLYDTGKDIETSRKHFVTENENQRERTKTEKRGIQVPNIPQVEISSKHQLDGSQSKVADKITTENRQNENTAMKMNKRRGIFGFLKKKFKETENSFHTDTKPQLQLKRKGSTSQEKIDKLTPLEMAKLTPHIDKPHDLTEETEMPKKSAINESSVKSKLELNKNAKHEVETTESRKRILGFLFKNKKYKNKEKTSTYHKAEEFLKILEDTKTFLDKETEMYHDIRSNLTSENLNILILNIPTESESQDSEENIGNILKDTSTFIQNEINNYYDNQIQTYSEKPEDEYYVNIPEYTAFDFIKEEIETFEATKLPNTSKVDSSIRIETEVETIDGDSPKEIITKKIVISEKLMEMKDVLKNNTSEEIFKKLMVVNEDLKAQLNINKLASSESEKPENSTMHETTNMSISESNEDQIRGFLSENMNQASNRNKDIHETITREIKKLEKVQEHMENECLPKFKNDKLAESTIVEDVSLFEGGTNILKNKEQEVVTDLDDITSDEISSVDSQHGEEIDRMLMDKYQEYSDEQLPIIEDNIAEQRIEKNTQFTQTSEKEKLRSQTSEYQNFESSNERSPKKKIIVTKLSERGSIFSEVMQVPEDFITDLKIEYSPYKKQSKGHPDEIQQTHSEENKTITNNTRRKPLFRIESEEEHSVNSTEVDAINPINEELDNLLRDLKMSNSEIRNVDIKPEENVDLTEKTNQSAQDDIETIEKKLRDLGNALDTLEQLDETELSEKYKVREKKLRRVERKFERMASETDELATVSKQTVELTNPAENEQYQQLVSQLSQDEVMSFQGDYNNLWDEYTFSKSNELDSKTPESQADVFELPQDISCKQLTDSPQKFPTNIQPPQPRPRHQKSKEQSDDPKDTETVIKQISPVRDDLLDENDKTEDISYQDKKKFWENITKDPSKKPSEMITLSKRNSIQGTDAPPVPKPRGTLQFSHSVAETTTEKISLVESKDEIETTSTLFKDQPIINKTVSSSDKIEIYEEHKPANIQPIQTEHPQDIEDSSKEVHKSDSVETDTEGPEETSSQGDNAGYISDSGDVEHYISDSEIEDRVPQIRERQMSVFIPPSVSQRTRYERSASLPTEDLYEVSARSTKLRKQYYEEQIKKEMIKEQLTIDLEDEGSPERKSIASPEVTSEEAGQILSKDMPTNERTDTVSASEHEKYSVQDLQYDDMNFIIPKNEAAEIHVDKSETEKSEKLIEVDSNTLSGGQKSKFDKQENIPEITFTLSGKQRRISEESDEFAVENEVEKITSVSEQEEIVLVFNMDKIQEANEIPASEILELSKQSETKIINDDQSLNGISKSEDIIVDPNTSFERSEQSDSQTAKGQISSATEVKHMKMLDDSHHEKVSEISTQNIPTLENQISSEKKSTIQNIQQIGFEQENDNEDKTSKISVMFHDEDKISQEINIESSSDIQSLNERPTDIDQSKESAYCHRVDENKISGETDDLSEIDLGSEDLKIIVSRLENMHKIRKLKGFSKLPRKIEISENILKERADISTISSKESKISEQISDQVSLPIKSSGETEQLQLNLTEKSGGPIKSVEKIGISEDMYDTASEKIKSTSGNIKQKDSQAEVGHIKTLQTPTQSIEELEISDDIHDFSPSEIKPISEEHKQIYSQVAVDHIKKSETPIHSHEEIKPSENIHEPASSPIEIASEAVTETKSHQEEDIKDLESSLKSLEEVTISADIQDQALSQVSITNEGLLDFHPEVDQEKEIKITTKYTEEIEISEEIHDQAPLKIKTVSEEFELMDSHKEMNQRKPELSIKSLCEIKISEEIHDQGPSQIKIISEELEQIETGTRKPRQEIRISEEPTSQEFKQSSKQEIDQVKISESYSISPENNEISEGSHDQATSDSIGDECKQGIKGPEDIHYVKRTEIAIKPPEDSKILSGTYELKSEMIADFKIGTPPFKREEKMSGEPSNQREEICRKYAETSKDSKLSSDIVKSKSESYSVINQPKEDIDNTIWEVSVESEILKEEKLTSLPSSCNRESIDTRSDSTSDKINDDKYIDENTTDETNLESEKFDQEPSDSLPSNKLEFDDHDDMKKIILESLHQQKVDPEEAKLIAKSLIEEIELEIQKVENFNRGLTSKSESLDSEKHVTDYLKELAEAKGLDQREVELVESVLERRQRQISKLSRGDTQASSMEITDEDLRYSEADYDYSNVLQQQMGQLEAEYSDHLKNVYDSLVEDQSAINISSNGTVPSKQAEENQNISDRKEYTNKDELIKSEKSYVQRKDIILEEDENVTESLIDELDNTQIKTKAEDFQKVDDQSSSQTQLKTEISATDYKDQITNNEKESEQTKSEYTTTIKGEMISSDVSQEFHTPNEQNNDHIKTTYAEKEEWPSLKADTQSEMQKYAGERVSDELELSEEKENSKESIKRTSSSDSKSSIGSNKTPDDLYSTCSSSKKIDSETSVEVVFRKSKKHDESSFRKVDRKSGIDLETYSSSGESHYHSFEIDNKSRPCSSDLEGILPTGSSEYESALNSQELSMKSQVTSGEYHTAISSLSSKESMMSIESESSGNLASIEISETSETLVPTNSDLEADIDIVDQQMFEDNEFWPTPDFENNGFTSEDQSNQMPSIPSSTDTVDIPSKMKRSYEMTFQPEPKILTTDSPHMESNDIDEKFGTSLDDGSALSVSLSSTSSAQLRTVIELSRTESGGPEESLQSAFSDHFSLEDNEILTKTSENIVFTDSSTSTPAVSVEPIESVTILSATITNNGISSVCSQVTTETLSSMDTQKSSHEELKKKGHRRQESTSFIPSLIHSVVKSSEPQTLLEDEQEPDTEITKLETPHDKAMDLSIRQESTERRDSHGKSSNTSSEKSSFEEAEAEAAFNMVAHISPVHKIKQICPIIEDIDAEKTESESKERAEKERIERANQIKDASPGSIPDIKVTEHMAPLDESKFRYPELEIERKELEQENRKSPDTEISRTDEQKAMNQYYYETEDIILEGTESSKKNAYETRKEEPLKIEKISRDIGSVEKTISEDERASDSPNSDSFELVEKPDIIDDFVVIEEIGKEASEMDSEGKSMAIQAKPKSHRKRDEEIDAYLARSDPTPLTKMTELKYFPDTNYELEFEFEDSPPQTKGDATTKDYGSKYDQELEANRKWIEQQFHGDHAAMSAAGYGYEMEFERGPLEDIKEEDINDIDLASSRIGSLGSQKESGGSLGSIKDSYSSTPEYDVLAGRRYFTRSGEHDDISMSSLQEFENLERAMSLETKRIYHGSGSQESSSNGSFKTRYYTNKGDDISVSSLKEFEGLERACIAVYKTEIKVKEEEELLSQIEEVQEVEKIEKDVTERSKVTESDEEDYEKRMFEIDEIIRQAQNNVERFIDLKEPEKTESLGRGDSIEEVSKVPDLDLDAPLNKSSERISYKDDDPMVTSTDSLDIEQDKPIQYGSTDSLDQKNVGMDLMTASTDSIEFNNQLSKNITTDSIENKTDGSNIVCSDSLDIGAAMCTRPQMDSLDEDEPKIFADHSSSDTGKDLSSSVRDDADEHLHELMLGSTDSLEPTSSTATHATYQYETDSVFSGSFTSGGSNTMVSSTDTIDPNMSKESVDIAAAVRKVWFEEGTTSSGRNITTEFFEESSMPYVTEVIEPSDDPAFSHTIHRRVQMPVEIRKVTFHGGDADEKVEQFIKDFGENEEQIHETEEIDADGNVHTRRIIQKRFVIRSGEEATNLDKAIYCEGENLAIRQQFEMCPSVLTTLTKITTGETSQSSGPSDTTISKAQAFRRRPLRYDISVDDQTEVDPREHDWLFNLNKDGQPEFSSEKEGGEHRQQPIDQHQLSSEMKELLKEMEEASKK